MTARVPHIRPASPADQAAIRAVHDAAFACPAEGALVDALCDGGYARLSLVAEDAGLVVGHVLFSDLPIATPSGAVPALALAPLAVLPDRQRLGVGSRLVAEGLRLCAAAGHVIVVVLGDVRYYSRFGFDAPLAEPLTCAWSGPHLMAVELVPGALAGVSGELRYPPPFALV